MIPPLLVAAAMVGLPSSPIADEKSMHPNMPRFQKVAPFPALPSVLLDVFGNGYGLAQQTARSKNLQARILWIDATANLDRINSTTKIEQLVKKIKDVGFNTIVVDVKPLVGYTIYPSKLTEKLTKWRDGSLPLDFDPVKVLVPEARKAGLSVLATMNVFSEGHRIAKEFEKDPKSPFGKPGPGYERVDQQTVLYEPIPVVVAPNSGERFEANEFPDKPATGPDQLVVATRTERATKLPSGAFGVVLDGDGRVVVGRSADQWSIPGIPQGGSVLIGTGKAADFLRRNAGAGSFVFDSRPVFVPISKRPDQQIPLMMNPNHPEVRIRCLNFIKEILGNYAFDGLIFDDRLRYGGMNADFSEVTRKQFESFVGKSLNWPDDVFKFSLGPNLSRGVKPGKYYDAWLAWRAETLQSWVEDARRTVDATRPGALLGVYAGSWFGEYHKFGNNYSSNKFNAGFSFMTEDYQQTGFAHSLDFLVTGCYNKMATIAEAMEWGKPTGQTVEAGGQLSNRAVRDQAWSYAGILLENYYGNVGGLERALQAAAGSTQGVMVFDLSHRMDWFWDVFRRAFKSKAQAPHMQKGLLSQVRQLRDRLDKMGVKEPPTYIREGAPGTGM